MAGFSAEAVLVRTAEALDATSGARGQTGRQQDDAEDRSILGRESAEAATWLGLSERVPRGPVAPGQLTTAGEARASRLSHTSTTAQTTRKWTYAATLPYVNGIASIASHTFFATVPLT